MRLIFEDHFEAGLKPGWGYGIRPDGTQWGSAAHFATKAEGAQVYTIAEP